MIEYNIKDPKFFLLAMKSISNVVPETVLQFGSGLRTFGMDGGRICLYEMVLGKSMLDVISDGNIRVMISTFDLQKVLSRFRSPEYLTILYDNKRIIIKGKIGERNKTFRLAILDTELTEDIIENLNKLQLDSVFNIDLADFVDMIEDGEIYSEVFRLKTMEDKVVIDGEGVVGDFSSEIYVDTTGEEQCQYSTDFAKKILKTLGSQEVTVSFSKDSPIMVYNKLSPDSYLRWYLAPRVEQDEDY